MKRILENLLLAKFRREDGAGANELQQDERVHVKVSRVVVLSRENSLGPTCLTTEQRNIHDLEKRLSTARVTRRNSSRGKWKYVREKRIDADRTAT